MTTEGRIISNISNQQQPQRIANTATQAQRYEKVKPNDARKLSSNDVANKRNAYQTNFGEKLREKCRDHFSGHTAHSGKVKRSAIYPASITTSSSNKPSEKADPNENITSSTLRCFENEIEKRNIDHRIDRYHNVWMCYVVRTPYIKYL